MPAEVNVTVTARQPREGYLNNLIKPFQLNFCLNKMSFSEHHVYIRTIPEPYQVRLFPKAIQLWYNFALVQWIGFTF